MIMIKIDSIVVNLLSLDFTILMFTFEFSRQYFIQINYLLSFSSSSIHMQSNKHSRSVSDQKLNEGSWNSEECLKYLIFLDKNKLVMSSRRKKNRLRVFDQMSDFVGTRSSLQCRSHHQKAIEKYKQVKQIIFHQKQLLDMNQYRVRVKEFRQKAKVREKYEKQKKPQTIKNDIESKKEIKQQKGNPFPPQGIHLIQNLINPLLSYPLQMIPISQTPIFPNYFYCPFFIQN